jgi:CcmD family protein
MNSLGFLVAGYVLTWCVLLWYVWRLERRVRNAERVLELSAKIRGPGEPS